MFTIIEIVSDEYRPFIKERMEAVDSIVYNKEEFDLYFSSEHCNLVFKNEDDEILVFCCIIPLEEYTKMCYSWCKHSFTGKKAYAKAIDYMMENFSPIGFGPGALKLNKIRRLIK